MQVWFRVVILRGDRRHVVSLTHQLSHTPEASKEEGKREIVKIILPAVQTAVQGIYSFVTLTSSL